MKSDADGNSDQARPTHDGRGYGEQDENGVDISLIRENLKLSVHDRLMKATRARKSLQRLNAIGRSRRTV